MKDIQFNEDIYVLVFMLDEMSCGLSLSVVERVFRVVEITPLPHAPEIVNGVVNIRGRIIPVINVHKRFRMQDHETGLDDRLIIASTTKRIVALVVDSVLGVRKLMGRNVSIVGQRIPFVSYIQGVSRLSDDMIFIYDLDQFLSLDEEIKLDMALAGDKS